MDTATPSRAATCPMVEPGAAAPAARAWLWATVTPWQQISWRSESWYRRINSVSLSRIVNDPSGYRPGQVDVQEALLTVAWGFASRIDLEPATCETPDCDADHGLTGQLVGDDLVMRMSSDADGAQGVARLVRFGLALQRATNLA